MSQGWPYRRGRQLVWFSFGQAKPEELGGNAESGRRPALGRGGELTLMTTALPLIGGMTSKKKYHKLHNHFILRLSHNAQTLCGSNGDSCGGERALALAVGKGQ